MAAVQRMFGETDLPKKSPWYRIPSKSVKQATVVALRQLVTSLKEKVEESKKSEVGISEEVLVEITVFYFLPFLCKYGYEPIAK
jgi:hypothetical protein